jgi:hypothetical protein
VRNTNRLEEERAYWRRAHEHGKAAFVLRTTCAIGSIATLLTYPIRRMHIVHSGMLLIFLASSVLCFAIGYLISELVWRRGLRLTDETSRKYVDGHLQ